MILRTSIVSCFYFLLTSFSYEAKDPALYYISAYSAIAKKEMQRSGIPASIKLAQALLESESGNSPLAIEGNNHFGIKCGRDWQGKTYYKMDDDADQDGNSIESCFRVFDQAEDSYIAHSDFLKDPKKSDRYGFLFNLSQTDYRAWAEGLRNAGYASDPSYPDKLIRIIEKYRLFQYDEDLRLLVSHDSKIEKTPSVSINTNQPNIEKNSTTKEKPSRLKPTDVVKPGEMIALKNIEVNGARAFVIPQNMTVDNIAKILHIKAIELIAYNEMLYAPEQVVFENSYIYTCLKNKDYKGKENQYVVRKGESLELISNAFGIRANTLYSLNRIPKGNQPAEGEIINLKNKIDKKKAPKNIKESRPQKVLFSMN
jgi:LysM repeat protein